MKTIKALFSFLLFSFTSSAQLWNWVKLETQATDPLTFQQYHVIAADDSGNVYYTSTDNTSVSKYDRNGNFLWLSIASSTPGNYGHSIAQSSWNEYITGNFQSNIVFDNDTVFSGSSTRMFVAKYNAGGTVLWGKQSKGTARITGDNVASDGAGNVFVTGSFYSGSLIFGSDTVNSPYMGLYVVKFDRNGNYLWARTAICPNSFDSARIMAVTTDSAGDVLIAGYYNTYLVFGTDSLPTTTSSSPVNAFAAKYDANGNLLWLWAPSMPTGSAQSFAYSISADKKGDAYVCGDFVSGTLFDGSITLGPSTGFNPFFTKINSGGSVSWAKQCFQWDNAFWFAQDISTDSIYNGYLLLEVDWSNSNYKISVDADTFKFYRANYYADVLVEFDSAGNVKCGSIFSEGTEMDGDGMNVSPSGKFVYVAGDLANWGLFGNDSLMGSYDQFFIGSWKTCDSITTGINSDKNKNDNVKIYPNPTRDKVVFETFADYTCLQVEIYDVFGQLVQAFKLNSVMTTISTSEFARGIYLYRIIKDDSVLKTGKIVLQ